jgi:hypothetical protein
VLLGARELLEPPHYGLSQRELETLSSEENRLVLFNFLPSIALMSLARVLRWAVTEPALSPATAVKLIRQDWSRP